jgi:hypothetical protein
MFEFLYPKEKFIEINVMLKHPYPFMNLYLLIEPQLEFSATDFQFDTKAMCCLYSLENMESLKEFTKFYFFDS